VKAGCDWARCGLHHHRRGYGKINENGEIANLPYLT